MTQLTFNTKNSRSEVTIRSGVKFLTCHIRILKFKYFNVFWRFLWGVYVVQII